jgi:hypothetical protein
MKPVPDEDGVPLLRDVTERANEVIPVQHHSKVTAVAALIPLPRQSALALSASVRHVFGERHCGLHVAAHVP